MRVSSIAIALIYRRDRPFGREAGVSVSLEEPVRRYLEHAGDGTRARLTMRGRIKAGRWLPFRAEQDLDGHSFEWRARVGVGPLTPLTVVDRFAGGTGTTTGVLFGRKRLFGASGPDTTRSAAGRAGLEAIWVPGRFREPDVEWRVETHDHLVATLSIPPERVEVHLQIGPGGELRSAWAPRWGDVGRDGFGYIPCGCEVRAERRFGRVTVPSRVSVGWWWGTPRYEPFFEAELTTLG